MPTGVSIKDGKNREAEMHSIERMEVEDIIYDGGAAIECYDPERGNILRIAGSFRQYNTDQYGMIKHAVFKGNLYLKPDCPTKVELDIRGDRGILKEIPQMIPPHLQLIEANTVYAVFYNLHTGKEEVLISQPECHWNPHAGILYGRFAGMLMYFHCGQ